MRKEKYANKPKSASALYSILHGSCELPATQTIVPLMMVTCVSCINFRSALLKQELFDLVRVVQDDDIRPSPAVTITVFFAGVDAGIDARELEKSRRLLCSFPSSSSHGSGSCGRGGTKRTHKYIQKENCGYQVYVRFPTPRGMECRLYRINTSSIYSCDALESPPCASARSSKRLVVIVMTELCIWMLT